MINLIKSENHLDYFSKSTHLFYGWVNIWKKHIKLGFSDQLEGFYKGIEVGDINYACYNFSYSYSWSKFINGLNLQILLKEFHKLSSYIYKVNRIESILMTRILNINIKYLSSKEIDINKIKKTYKECKSLDNKMPQFVLRLSYITSNYFLENYPKALNKIKENLTTIDSVVGNIITPEFHFYYSLTLISIHKNPNTVKIENEKLINKQLKQWKRWSEACEENYLHKYLLIQAEWARVNGNILEAMELYDKSIDSAKENEYTQNAALASKLAGKFYLSIDKPKFARMYFMDAYYGYMRWGAKLYANHIEENYIKKYFQFEGTERRQNQETITSSTSSSFIDLNSLIKSSRLISGEVKLDSLLNNLINIIIENAGAQKGILILEENNKLFVYAESELNQESDLTKKDISENLAPMSIIQYVFRTKETIIINNAKDDKRFMNDKYLSINKVLSLACIPIKNQNHLIAILYIENNILPNAFTNEKMEVLNILCSQAAISIQNAKLYEDLENKNEKLIILNKTKDEFLSNLSHELKTPLSVIYAYSQMIPNQLDNPKKLEKYSSQIFINAEKLNQYVSDLIFVTDIESNFELQKSETEINKLLSNAIKDLKDLQDEKGVKVNFRSSNEIILNCDPILLTKTFSAIIKNAIVYNHGDLLVDIQLFKNPTTSEIEISIKDTGIGIAVEYLQKIFDK
ncbi:MAG: GAF domain-containing protein, partial [Leptospiraceae bacterium]|nr:GAF domain-containing protein [Leptospiraceae bacterium]